MQIGLNEKESKKIDDNFESKDLSDIIYFQWKKKPRKVN